MYTREPAMNKSSQISTVASTTMSVHVQVRIGPSSAFGYDQTLNFWPPPLPGSLS